MGITQQQKLDAIHQALIDLNTAAMAGDESACAAARRLVLRQLDQASVRERVIAALEATAPETENRQDVGRLDDLIIEQRSEMARLEEELTVHQYIETLLEQARRGEEKVADVLATLERQRGYWQPRDPKRVTIYGNVVWQLQKRQEQKGKEGQ